MNEQSQANAPYRFIVAGSSLLSLRKELKPALPRPKQESSYLVVITGQPDSVKVAIAGAAVDLPAITNAPFVAELPYSYFKCVLIDSYAPGALIQFELDLNAFSVNEVTTRSPAILVKSGTAEPAATPPPSPHRTADVPNPTQAAGTLPVIADPLDGVVGAPLLAAYAHIRKYGIQPFTASKTFAKQQVEVDELLKRADRLLRPVGITRADLERMLDRKVGLI